MDLPSLETIAAMEAENEYIEGNKIQACCKRTHMYHVQHAIPIRKWGVIENVQMNAPGGRTDFAKYWDQYSVILAMGAALDPRLKLDILRSAYEKIDLRTSEE
uniref:hAT-like transposase RNase-H fold domain-containing protein n=1 Tax=Brassica oleracea var. oleracea TaxID=109376 RepID=A0A0D2ZPL9_BRAOL